MHEVLVNRLGGLSLPRRSVVRLTDRPDMTLDVYRGRKTTMQQQPPLVQNTTNYHLRNSNNLRSIHANTIFFYNSFFPSTIRAWKNLSEDIKNSPSVAVFKYRLNETDIHRLNISTLVPEWVKYFMHEYEWNAVLSIILMLKKYCS